MELSNNAKAILSLCWEDDERRCTTFIADGKHEYITKDGLKYKPNNDTYEELEKYQAITDRPFKLYRNGDYVNITGGVIVK